MELTDNIEITPSSAPLASKGSASNAVRAKAGLLRLSGLVGSSVMTTVATGFAVFGITAVQGVILARLLGPEERGEFGTAVFFTYALSSMGLLGTQFAVARRSAMAPDGRAGLRRSVLKLGFLTGVMTLGVVSLLAVLLLPDDKQFLAPLCAMCALAQPLEHVRLLLLAVDQGAGAFRRFNIVTLATSAVLPVALLMAWCVGVMSVFTAAILVLFAPAVGLLVWAWLSDYHADWHTGPPTSPRVLLREGAPYWVSAAVCDLYSRLDQFLFLSLASLVAQGYYSAAVPAAGMLLVGADALALFSFNAGSREQVRRSRTELFRSGLLVVAFQITIAAAYAIAIGPLIVLFYGREFAPAIPYALALIPGQALHGFARVAEGHLRGRGVVRVGVWARVFGAVFMVAMVALLYDRFGVLSIPLATSSANGLVAFVLGWYALTDARPDDFHSPLVAEGCAR
jgi:O-antigen/teichoic acid export membrane protein